MKKIFLHTILLLMLQNCFGQYSSIDTLYYPNQQIERIVMKLEGDTITIQKRYYSQYLKLENSVFQLGDKKADKIESIETYINWGQNGLMQEGYSEYWYENGNKRLEVVYSRKKGDKYINQWELNSNQILKSGNGIYTQLDIGINGLDSLVYEVRDSIFHGKSKRYAKNKKGEYYLRTVRNFEKNKPIGTKETYNSEGRLLIQEEYLDSPNSIMFKSFYENGKLKESGIILRNMKSEIWRYYLGSGKIEKEIEYLDGYYCGKYKEYYANGIVKADGDYNVIVEEREVNLIDIETFEETKSIKKDKFSVKNGEWIYYKDEGEIEKIELYENGKLK